MGLYAVTGGASGIGAAIVAALRARGDEPIVVDLRAADVEADLSTPDGRKTAVAGIAERSANGLDGFVACAGLGPETPSLSAIDRVNYFGAVATLEGALPLVERRRGAVVAVGSNSAPLPHTDEEHVRLLASGDEDAACAFAGRLDGGNVYAGSKRALLRWVRRNAPDWMRRGVRLNAVAPGVTETAMTDAGLRHETYGPAIAEFAKMTPYGKMASPDMVAAAILFLLSDAASFVSGSVLFVDGGMDAQLRPDAF